MTPFPRRRVLDDLLFLLVVPLCLLETDHDALRLSPALVVLVASLLQTFRAPAAWLRVRDRLVLPALVALTALGWALTLVLAVIGRPAVLDVTSPVEYLLAVAMVVQVVLTGRALAVVATQGEPSAPTDAPLPS